MSVARGDALALDAGDPLAGFRDRFVIADPDLCYLDGNSLGRLPKATAERLRRLIDDEWGAALVTSWDSWIDLPLRAGDAIAPLIGAPAGSVVATDSTTVDLHAILDAACAARPDRQALVVPDGDFPTDRYVVEGIAAARGLEVRLVASDPVDGPAADGIAAACSPGDVAVVVCSMVDFRSGALADVASIADSARGAGAWVCLDLSHAVASVPVDLAGLGVELAVGCTYKHLCAGPGAPAFLYVRPDLAPELRRPQWGWFAQDDQFAMGPAFEPADGQRRFLAGSPGVLGLAAIEVSAAMIAEAGMGAIRAKSLALSRMVLGLVEERLVPLGFALASPADPSRLGAHVAVSHPDATAIGFAARLAGVIPDVRPPDRIRFGLSPLQVNFVEVWDGLDRIARLVAAGEHVAHRGVRPRIT